MMISRTPAPHGIIRFPPLIVNFGNIVLQASQKLFVRYLIPQEAPVVIRLFDVSGKLIKRFDVGTRALGDHTECCAVQDIAANRVLIVALSAGKTTLSSKVVMR